VTDATGRRRRLAPELIGLFLVYAATVGLALWQASEHPTPTIFSDELEMTQLARSIAATGHGTLRGLPRSGIPLGAYMSAPFWWVHDVPTAYVLLKAWGALVMATAVFPAYGLARLAVTPRWALFAAAGTGISPALAYAPVLVKEPTAYAACTLALFLVARFLAKPSWRGFLLAVASCILGWQAKDQLVTLFGVLGIALFMVAWRSARVTAFRSTWTSADWVGAVVLTVGLLVILNAMAAHHSLVWYTSTTFFQDRMLDYSLWAGGSLAIGLGIVPLIAGLASVVRPKGEPWSPGVDALAIVTATTVFSFCFYTAIKGTWLSLSLADLTLERNLIFLGPLLFAGTALFLQRRGGRWWAVVAAGLLALYLVHVTPYSLTSYPNYEAHGLAIIALANRIFRWPASTIEHALMTVSVVGTVLLLLVPRIRSMRAAAAVAAGIAAFTLAWTGTTEVYAAHGESLFSKRLYATLPKPVNWLDKTTQRRSVVFLGQAVRDPNPVNLLEFWNRSLVKVWALDGSAPGPGATATPNVDKPDGTLTNPHTDFVLVTPGVDVVGKRIGLPVGGYSLFRLDGDVIKLRTAQTGVYPDGWIGATSSYSQYAVPPGQTGTLVVVLSRTSWCGKDVRSVARVRVGPIAIDPQSYQPVIGEVTSEASVVLHSCQSQTLTVPTPGKPWRAEVTIVPTFSPAAIDPRQSDQRQLGAVVTYRYVPER
jgi:hypothetical protein